MKTPTRMDGQTLIVGEGDADDSWTLCYPKGTHWPEFCISKGRKSFSVNNVLGRLGMRIMHDTQEGADLDTWIKERRDAVLIQCYLQVLLVKEIPVKDLLTEISRMKLEAYKDGATNAKREVRKALGIEK